MLRAHSQILVYGLTGRGLGGGAGSGILWAKSWNKVYSMRRYPFMNNNGCQICFILLPNLLVWIEIINIQKLVTHVTHYLSGVYTIFALYWSGRVTKFANPNTQLKTRLDAVVAMRVSGTNFALITKYSILIYLPFYIWSWYINEMKVHIRYIYYYKFEMKLLLITNTN